MQVLFHDQALDLVGEPLEDGDQLPKFKVFTTHDKKIKTKDLLGKPVLLSVMPDIDTRVCSIQTKKFNQQADKYSHVQFVAISNNSVADQAGWCAKEGVKNLTVASDEELSFGYATNLYLPNNGTLTRAIYVADADGKIVYHEIVPNVSHEPNYVAALEALKQFE
ncbi:thiol peroxidase [Lactobacillus pentosus]|uniref:thiol peroxidase n=1 Tax=Lactiplantibacillus pentosus TaxID=1589 RepID=UPI00142505D6|nr:thiol peroxidase [Lactiplantibacillus pentosus]MPQ20210.1 thiol peroxidase [Lactiplantibacillus pentosus]UXI96399.1 thiol peroxidase [Lactiplantibacillus pentosus]